ncbi:MAG TPA: COX15/CtaA family protein [Myxococcota bacterium]|nr:COX15/CtaA family protein [Myxococcota bacterium]
MTTPFPFSLITVLSTWALLIIGGLVNPMGASMACPDWYFFPTCNGEILPVMEGGVLYEHGHRLVATIVGISTSILTFLCWRTPGVSRLTKRLCLLALLLVVLQGTLGGITVLLNLSALVSTLHLACAMIFFSLLIYISFRLSPDWKPVRAFDKSLMALLIAILLTLGQLVYGGVVRHMGAGLACGDDLIGCGPEIWPSWFYGQLHMGHRFLGYAIFFVVLYACIKARKFAVSNGDKLAASLSLLPVFITFCQIGLGLMAIYTVRSPSVLAMHTGFGALLLASLLAVYLMQLQANHVPTLLHGQVSN